MIGEINIQQHEETRQTDLCNYAEWELINTIRIYAFDYIL